jgi:sugar lactone lactonase YvrE
MSKILCLAPRLLAVLAVGATIAGAQGAAPAGVQRGQPDMTPTNDAPNPYQTIEGWAKMPAGRTWGATSAVEIASDGVSIWVGERCGANRCVDAQSGIWSNSDPILLFDASGNLVRSFGAAKIIFPHGIHVDRQGNVWVTDGHGNRPDPTGGARGGGRAGGGAAGGAPGGAAGAAAGDTAGRAAAGGGRGGGGRGGPPTPPGAPVGMQIFKYAPDGRLLLTLGAPGGAATDSTYFYQPNDVLVAPNGTIFVSEGHGGGIDRILKFDSTGTLMKTWGRRGSGPGEFNQPHALAMDSQGRLFVGDRSNNRVQIFDQDGNHIDSWYQFSRPSGLWIDANDVLYVADSESGSIDRNRSAWRRGIRIGSAKDGRLTAFVPDPSTATSGTHAAEGVAVDRNGVIYGAEVGERALKRYVKR